VGFVFQSYHLIPTLTVCENVMLALVPMRVNGLVARARALHCIERVGLERRINHLPGELSGGEQQRACLARALVNSPAVLLADEPTGNLDPATSWDILQLLDKINKRNTTVVVATHNKNIVDEMKKRVVVLENGRLIRDQQLGMYHV